MMFHILARPSCHLQILDAWFYKLINFVVLV